MTNPLKITYLRTDELIPYARNSRTHSAEQVAQIAASIREFGFTNPVLVDEEGTIIAGHGRVLASQQLKLPEVPTITLHGLTDAQRRAYVIADNRLALNAGWDEEMLAVEIQTLAEDGFDLALLGFTDDELADLMPEVKEGDDDGPDMPGFLGERFGIPPFSVFDTRQGYWQERKRKWLEVIGDNGESREETLFKAGNTEASQKMAEIGTVSILDPVMAEVVVRWFSPKGGRAFDTFAGDTVFGFVAGMLGRQFAGIELRKEQAALNNKRVQDAKLPAHYINDDGQNAGLHFAPNSQDLFFSCPPYFDLEVYSSDPRDASNQGSYSDFLKILDTAFTGAAKALKPNRFAVVVMSNVRDRRGFYQDICGDIRSIMRRNGLHIYNEIILLNAVGSASMRAGNYMKNRKVARTHQEVMVFFKGGEFGDEILATEGFDLAERARTIRLHDDILVFYKGDPKTIPSNFGEVEAEDVLAFMHPDREDDK
ncbi:MAG: hypothetical protein RL758_40 [Pseudomonadota bacterium]|jgi:DNA modification methylase